MLKNLCAVLFATLLFFLPLQSAYAEIDQIASTAPPEASVSPSPTSEVRTTPEPTSSPEVTSSPTAVPTEKPVATVVPQKVVVNNIKALATLTPLPTTTSMPDVTVQSNASPAVLSYTVNDRPNKGLGFVWHFIVIILALGLAVSGYYLLKKYPNKEIRRRV